MLLVPAPPWTNALASHGPSEGSEVCCFYSVGLDLSYARFQAVNVGLLQIGHSGITRCVSRPPFFSTMDIHFESAADTPSITMSNVIVMTL